MRTLENASYDRTNHSNNRHPGFEGSDYWGEIAHIQRSDVGVRSELVMRYFMIVGAGLALFYATLDLLFLGWIALYMSTNAVYSVLLARTRAPVSLRWYWSLIAMNIVTSSSFAAMPIYLWLAEDDPSLRAMALFGLFGHAMFNLARHTRRTAIAYWDLVLMFGSTTAFGLNQIIATPNLVGQICIGFGTVALMILYAQAQKAIIEDREALASSRDAVIEAQKQSTMAQITAGVAHDFNNKLTVIQGNIELAVLTHDPIERAALLREAKQAGDKAADVVAHMQAFVRKSPLRISRIDLANMAAKVQRGGESYLPENMFITVQIDEGVDDINCDAGLLQTALMNLVLNARDAMEGQGGKIELRIAPGDLNNWSGPRPNAPGPYLRFDITDQGPGLPVEAFHRVQEPFYSSKPIGMGTGLGLSMVKGFAEQIGGAMMLRNRQVGGLEVSLILPKTARA